MERLVLVTDASGMGTSPGPRRRNLPPRSSWWCWTVPVSRRTRPRIALTSYRC